MASSYPYPSRPSSSSSSGSTGRQHPKQRKSLADLFPDTYAPLLLQPQQQQQQQRQETVTAPPVPSVLRPDLFPADATRVRAMEPLAIQQMQEDGRLYVASDAGVRVVRSNTLGEHDLARLVSQGKRTRSGNSDSDGDLGSSVAAPPSAKRARRSSTPFSPPRSTSGGSGRVPMSPPSSLTNGGSGAAARPPALQLAAATAALHARPPGPYSPPATMTTGPGSPSPGSSRAAAAGTPNRGRLGGSTAASLLASSASPSSSRTPSFGFSYGAAPPSSAEFGSGNTAPIKPPTFSLAGAMRKSATAPAAAPAAAAENPLLAFMKKQPATWTCDACSVKNDVARTKCISCETDRSAALTPAAALVPAPAPIPAPQSTNPLLAYAAQQKAASADKWKCDACMVQNDAAKSKCVSCESPKATSSAPPAIAFSSLPPPPPPAGPLFSFSAATPLDSDMDVDLPVVAAAAARSWTFSTPDPLPYLSPVNAAAPGPAPVVAEAAPASTLNPLQLLMQKQALAAAGKWTCNCMVKNDVSASKCIACDAPRPAASAASQPTATPAAAPTAAPTATTAAAPPTEFNPLHAFMQQRAAADAGKWTCDCMVKNDARASKCIACDAPRPAASAASQPTALTAPAASTVPTATPAEVNPLLAFMQQRAAADAGKWTCDCMVKNNASTLNCVACEAPKPGQIGAAAAPVTFVFSSPAVEMPAPEPSSSTEIHPIPTFSFSLPSTTNF
ncbi:hypothetical protein BC828DRAFT_390890 [Blastocladiella britannica]|nr:hypothetical protein BC828DRAFT_390890 [Blastocladiella britannica]